MYHAEAALGIVDDAAEEQHAKRKVCTGLQFQMLCRNTSLVPTFWQQLESLLLLEIAVQVQLMTEPNTPCVQQGLAGSCILSPRHLEFTAWSTSLQLQHRQACTLCTPAHSYWQYGAAPTSPLHMRSAIACQQSHQACCPALESDSSLQSL